MIFVRWTLTRSGDKRRRGIYDSIVIQIVTENFRAFFQTCFAFLTSEAQIVSSSNRNASSFLVILSSGIIPGDCTCFQVTNDLAEINVYLLDGSLIDEEEYFSTLKPQTTLILQKPGEKVLSG